MSDHRNHQPSPDRASPRHRVRLPGFVSGDEEVGLGDAVGRATSALGVRQCGGCMRRATVLNQWLSFTPSRRRHE